MSTVQDATAEHWDCTNDEYHRDTTSLSRSQLEDFMHSPALYESRHLLRLDGKESSEALAFGTLVHRYLLESETIVEIPASVLSSSGSKAGGKWKEFEEANSGKLLLKPHEFIPLRRICDSIDKHSWASKLMRLDAGDKREYTVRWHDPETDLARRIRLDNVKPAMRIVADLKTARSVNARDFSRDAYNLGYARQAAFYMDGVRAMWPGDEFVFLFIAIEKSAPYSVEVFEFDGQFLDLGYQQNLRAMKSFAKCQAEGRWRPDHHGQVVTLSPPAWAGSEEQWEVGE